MESSDGFWFPCSQKLLQMKSCKNTSPCIALVQIEITEKSKRLTLSSKDGKNTVPYNFAGKLPIMLSPVFPVLIQGEIHSPEIQPQKNCVFFSNLPRDELLDTQIIQIAFF